MKYGYWLAFSVCVWTTCVAQYPTDSLKTLLAISKKEGKTDNVATYLSYIGLEFLSTQQYDSALVYYYESLKYASGYPELLASTLDCIGVAYNYKGFPDSSIYYYNRALLAYALIDDSSHMAVIENNLAIIFKTRGVYNKAIEVAFSALSKLEKKEPGRLQASCYNTIGSIYDKISDYPNALLYYTKALRIRQDIHYKAGIGQSYNNLGELYTTMHQYDSALTNLSRALHIKRELGDMASLGTTLNLMGVAYLELDLPQEAAPYFKESRRIKVETGERIGEAVVLNNLAELSLRMGDLRQAEIYVLAGEKLAREANALDELRKTLAIKVRLHKEMNDPVGALAFAEELMAVKDSLLNKEKAESLLSMQTAYETEKKEEQIASLQQVQVLQQAEIIAKRTWIWGLTIIISLMAINGVLLYRSYKQSQKNKNKVETLLKELHHRVKNNLQILSSIINLQSQEVVDENALLVMRSSESRVNTMALIHKKLYGSDGSRTIDMKEYTEELVQYLFHTYGFREKIDFILQCDTICVDVDVAIPLGLIINEVVSNALKYAYIDHRNPVLEIEMKTDKPRELSLKIRDNGPGIPEVLRKDSPQSFGLRMVKTLIKELKGKLILDSNGGTTFNLYIPIT